MTEQINKIKIPWYLLEQPFSGLKTDIKHEIEVQREAIPLVFVPGIMGSVLRVRGTNGEGKGDNALPNMRWNPSSSWWMLKHYLGVPPAHRRRMIIGPSGSAYNSDLLEVHNTDPIGNGFQGVSKKSYSSFLKFLQNQDWGSLNKVFEFPVYAVGYNWTDRSLNNGEMLAERIQKIIKEAKEVTGLCEKVILITHSMGGLVSRSASELAGAKDNIFGIIHGVQPVTGSPAAYWRVKAGFEGYGVTSRVLGNSGKNVTPILGNMPGGLELLPNHLYQDNNGNMQWLNGTEDGSSLLSLPNVDPYSEIYRVQGTGSEVDNPTRKVWGLIDPDLLDPSNESRSQGGRSASYGERSPDALDEETRVLPWEQYLNVLKQAELFQRSIGNSVHSNTYTFHGTGHDTADNIEMQAETVWVEKNSYPKRGFRGRYINNEGKSRRAILQAPSGDGDGTVPLSSGSALDSVVSKIPRPLATEAEHESAYNSIPARGFVIQSILTICQKRYKNKLGK